MAISQKIAEHIVGTGFDRLPAEVVRITKMSLLDGLGVTLAGASLGEGSRHFVDLVRESDTGGPCSVLGFGFTASPAMAAFANGALAHTLDYEDTHDPGLVHPNGAVIPAVLAIAQASARPISGKELVAAIALGADLTCRLSVCLNEDPEIHGWWIRPVLGVYGATAAAAKLADLDASQLVEAFSLALCQVTCTNQFKEHPSSHLREIRDAFITKAAVLSVQLAKKGVCGFAQPFEGKSGLFAMYASGDFDETKLLGQLGERFENANVSFKPWPSCRGNHAHIECAIAFSKELPSGIDSIARIHARVSPAFRALCEPLAQKIRPKTAIGARFSVPFTTAVALVKGKVGLSDFSADGLRDERVIAVAGKVGYTIEESWSFEESIRGGLELVTTSGKTLSKSIVHPLGHPSNPISERSLIDKFVDCASYAPRPLAPQQARRLATEILGELETQNDVKHLMSSLSNGA